MLAVPQVDISVGASPSVGSYFLEEFVAQQVLGE